MNESVDDALDDVRRRLECRMAGRDEFDDQVEAPARTKPGYFQVTRSLSASFIAALPLLVIYEVGILGMRRDINYAAEFLKSPIAWLKTQPTELFGIDPISIINAVLILIALIALWRLIVKGALHAGTFGGMLMESAVYALLLGPFALLMLSGRLQLGGFTPNFDNFIPKVVASCGAGLYEELLFRAVILGAIYVLAREGFHLKPGIAGALGLVLSGAIFSAAHFLSPAETADYGAFLYRLFAGIFLGAVFLTRGFGVAAWTHALYDVYVLCFTDY